MNAIEIKIWVFCFIILALFKVASVIDRSINYPNNTAEFYYDNFVIGVWYSVLLKLILWGIGIRLFVAFAVWFFRTF